MNDIPNNVVVCKSCSSKGEGNYCSNCGAKYETKRITLSSLVHEALHFFTHFDKGFPFTLKQLIIEPGVPQKQYVEGARSRYQKPFSMFFICASFSAIALYYIDKTVLQYFDGGDAKEVDFFHRYWVILQTSMLPLYTLITYIIFKRSKYNYGETGILQLYFFSVIFLMLILIHLLKLIWPHLQTRYIELPAVVLYTVFSFVNFYENLPKIKVIIMSLISIVITFAIATSVQDFFVKHFF